MTLITTIDASWAQAERELMHGLSAQEAFSRFMQTAEKAEWLLQRLAELRNEYERILRLLNLSYRHPSEKSGPLILVDFDVIRAYIDNEATKRSDYLHIKHFFETSTLPFGIPQGAVYELRDYLKHTIGGGTIPDNIDANQILDRLESFAVEMVDDLSPIWSDDKIQRKREVLQRLILIVKDERLSKHPIPLPDENLRREVYDHVKAAIEQSLSHFKMSDQRKRRIAYNDSLSLAAVHDDHNRYWRAPSNEQPKLLLTTSRYLLRAANKLNAFRGRVVRPRILSLLYESRPGDGVTAAKASVTATISLLNSVHNAIRQQMLDAELNVDTGHHSDLRRLRRQMDRIWTDLRDAMAAYGSIAEIEGRRGPLLSYEWIQEELAMSSSSARRRGAAISYLKMLSFLERCVAESEQPASWEYRAAPCSNAEEARRWSILECASSPARNRKGGELELPVICVASLVDVDNAAACSLVLEWQVDAGWFPMLACLEDEYLASIRDAAVSSPILAPYVKTSEVENPTDDYGVTFTLPGHDIVAPARWIAAEGSLSFMKPWNLRKQLRKCMLEHFGKSVGWKQNTKVLAVKVQIPGEKLEFDVEPRAQGMVRLSTLTLTEGNAALRAAKVWTWIGGRVGRLDGLVEVVTGLFGRRFREEDHSDE